MSTPETLIGMAERRLPPTDEELRAMGRLTTHLVELYGEKVFINRFSSKPCLVLQFEGLSLCKNSGELTVRQDIHPYTLIYSEDRNGSPGHYDPLLLRYYANDLLRKFPLESLAVT